MTKIRVGRDTVLTARHRRDLHELLAGLLNLDSEPTPEPIVRVRLVTAAGADESFDLRVTAVLPATPGSYVLTGRVASGSAARIGFQNGDTIHPASDGSIRITRENGDKVTITPVRR